MIRSVVGDCWKSLFPIEHFVCIVNPLQLISYSSLESELSASGIVCCHAPVAKHHGVHSACVVQSEPRLSWSCTKQHRGTARDVLDSSYV